MMNSTKNFALNLKRLALLALCPLVLLTPSCGEKEKSKPRTSSFPGFTRKPGFGCVQGVVLNGFTGQRFDLSTITDPDGIYVLIRGTKLKAQFYKDDPHLVGEYFICDIPVENAYPIFANISGFLPFESQVSITSTRAIRTVASPGNVSEEAAIPEPIRLANFRLFPKESSSRSLVINVRKDNVPLSGALVDLQPLPADGQFTFNGDFVSTAGTRLLPTRKTTNVDGLAAFSSSEIAYGSNYRLKVTPAAQSNAAAAVTREFTLGFSGTVSTDRNTWEFNVDVSDTNEDLKVIACSSKAKSWDDNGTIVMTLNRPVQLSRGSDPRDQWTASLSGGQAELVASNTTNNASEHFDVNITGDGKILTLQLKSTAFGTGAAGSPGKLKKTPDYSKPRSESVNEDVDLTVRYQTNEIRLDLTDSDKASDNNKSLGTILGADKAACETTRFFQEYR